MVVANVKICYHLGGHTTQKMEFIGEPNRPSNVKITNHTGKDLQNINEKTGQIQA